MTAPVRGADRAIMVFEAFEEMKREASLREVAEYCGLPVSSCHAIVQTLLQRGYLYTVGKRKELYPSRRLFSLGQTLVANDPFIAHFSEQFAALRDETEETVTVAKRQGDLLLYLYTLESPHPIRYAGQPGQFRPLHSTAGGKALLSVLTPEELDNWLDSNDLEVRTPNTIIDRDRLKENIEEEKKKGYFVQSGEQVAGGEAVAVPISLLSDTIVVAVAGPIERMVPKRSQVGKCLISLKKEIEASIARPEGRR